MTVALLNSPLKTVFFCVSCSVEDANRSNFWKAVTLINWDHGQPKIIALNNTTSMVQITYILIKGNPPTRTLIRRPALTRRPSTYEAANVPGKRAGQD
jgi:hypothetical protein